MEEFLLFTVDDLRFGLPVTLIDHVVRMVLITPIIAAPQMVAGTINYHGEILPVFSLRARLSLINRDPLPEDLLIITGTGNQKKALIADHVTGVISFAEKPIPAEKIIPGLSGFQGIIRTGEGMILITDLDRFLFPDTENILQDALSSDQNGER